MNRRIIRIVLGLLFVLLNLCGKGALGAPSHVALLIGNSDYGGMGTLPNPANDALALGETLKTIGYDVDVVLDADYNTMRLRLNAFASKAKQAEVAIVFFAGHGIEIDKHNYLIPTDAQLENDSQVAFQAISLDMVSQTVSGASTLKIVLLDACRNNPFLAKMRSAGTARRAALARGLAAVEPEAGTIVGFSAREGTTASDGRGQNSPYTAALLRYISQPLLDVGRLFRSVRDDVLRATSKDQEPFLYGSLPSNDVYLFPQAGGQPKDNNGGIVPQVQVSEARIFWEEIKDSDDPGAFEALIAAFPDSVYARLARVRLNKLRTGIKPHGPEPVVAATFPGWYLALYRDVDLFGGDILAKGKDAGSVQECANACGANLSCKAFTYNRNARRCFLKSGYEFAQIYTGAVAGYFYEGVSEQEAPAFPVDWEVFEKSDLRGIDIGDSGARNYESCVSSCLNRGDCAGYVYVYFTKRNQCWLKTGQTSGPVYTSKSKRGMTSARRISSQIAPTTVMRLKDAR